MLILHVALMALSTLLFALAITTQVFASLGMLVGAVPADRGAQLYALGMGLAVLAAVGFVGGIASRRC